MNPFKVIVLAHNSQGEPEFFTYGVENLKADALEKGEHYELAKRSAAAHGYVAPMIAFDITDPATHQLSAVQRYLAQAPLVDA